ncbi:glucose 1-dehydrogenase [Haloferula chungangensis]|uniref:Glucose 1-dehydrogenase n=1 Tax=Haloferula chungangensis TaxID=1048331 RepID=A0ABW2L047_9BACT
MGNKSSERGQSSKDQQRPAQTQSQQPGREAEMQPQPEYRQSGRESAGLLTGRVALITGGDSGIGRATAVALAREGADIAIVYLEEDQDAAKTADLVTHEGRRCEVIQADIREANSAALAVDRTVERFGQLDILINNAAEQHPQESILDIDAEQLEQTFRCNVFPLFHFSKAALPHLRKSDAASIVNTTSVTAYRGSPGLIDYSATKGAIVSFTRSLSQQLASEGIRVNAVAPGPIWTPLIPATFPEDKVAKFGSDVPLGRAGHPWEVAECFVFLVSQDASYITGQVIHPNGGEIING